MVYHALVWMVESSVFSANTDLHVTSNLSTPVSIQKWVIMTIISPPAKPHQNSEYDQEIPQSQTADKPMAPRGRATQQSRDTRKTN